MLLKSVVIVGTAFLFIQVSSYKAASRNSLKEYVTINGTEFYIDVFGVSKDEATIDCVSRNMSLISFNEPQKWDNVKNWLQVNGFEWDWFWSSGIRFANSTTWIWEPTGENITDNEFSWGVDQPNLPPGFFDTCIDFRVKNGGWEDDDCSIYLLGFICE